MNQSVKSYFQPAIAAVLLVVVAVGASGCGAPVEGDPNPPATKVTPAKLKPYGTPAPTTTDPKPTGTGTGTATTAGTTGIGIPGTPSAAPSSSTATTTGDR